MCFPPNDSFYLPDLVSFIVFIGYFCSCTDIPMLICCVLYQKSCPLKHYAEAAIADTKLWEKWFIWVFMVVKLIYLFDLACKEDDDPYQDCSLTLLAFAFWSSSRCFNEKKLQFEMNQKSLCGMWLCEISILITITYYVHELLKVMSKTKWPFQILSISISVALTFVPLKMCPLLHVYPIHPWHIEPTILISHRCLSYDTKFKSFFTRH